MSGPRQVGQYGHTAFVEVSGAERRETAILLIGAARDNDLDDAYHVRATQSGFYISDELADLLYDEQDETAPEQDETAPEQDEPEVSGNDQTEGEAKADKPPKKASGNRAAKNSTTTKE